MFAARDVDGTIVWATDANKIEDYFCPVCGAKMILKAGDVNAWHFAHEANACPDTWNYDMSEWHRDMQEQFPLECREVVMTHNGETHRADVFKDNVVVEFQHSPISPSEFTARNNFYNGLGHKVAWVFDVSEQFENGSIYYEDAFFDDFSEFYWTRPLSVLRYGPIPQEDSLKAWVSICFYFGESDADALIRRVNWSSVNRKTRKPTYKTFKVDYNHFIELSPTMDMLDFFRSPLDMLRKTLKAEPVKHKIEFGTAFVPEGTYPKPCRYDNKRCEGPDECSYCEHYICGVYDNRTDTMRAYCAYPEKSKTNVTGDQYFEI
jgi:hypothetical protein